MTRYKIILEYDGTGLIGWQENRQGPSVQSLVSDAICKFCGQHIEVVGAGRTDAGVHALGMAAHFDLQVENSPPSAPSGPLPPKGGARLPETIKRALNFYLNASPVSVLSCKEVGADFHARFSCVRRNYRYVICNRSARPVLDKKCWWVPRPLDIGAIRAAAAALVGNHDFTSFRASECQAQSPIKTLDKVEIHNPESDIIIIDFSARSFLHHQVRNMVGTLIEIGFGKPLNISQILAARNRNAAGPAAPARGLFFISAEY